MIILGIETSCDETAAAVLQKQGERIQILSNVVASSASLQSKYGGIIPEQAAREQIHSIIPVVDAAISNAKCQISNIDAIAVTYGPGLIGSLLVGVEAAKTLATIWKKPLIPVNHLIGHFYANFIEGNKAQVTSNKLDTSHPKFPCLGLLVSGGHTDLVLFTDHGKYKYLGGTRDDAAGECFDKCARLLGLPYPGGPEISKLATKGDASRFILPVPMKGSKDLDFSYSGLKTAVANIVHSSQFIVNSNNNEPTNQLTADLAVTIENTIVQSLIDKVIQALKVYPVKDVMIAGGVAANKKLVSELKKSITNHLPTTTLHVPSAELCTDNGAMIASAAFFQKPIPDPLSLQADPNLSLNV